MIIDFFLHTNVFLYFVFCVLYANVSGNLLHEENALPAAAAAAPPLHQQLAADGACAASSARDGRTSK